MSSIGIVMRASGDAASLGEDWTPEPLGTRAEVLAAVARHLPGHGETLALVLTVEDGPAPRTISASGVWGERETAALRGICEELRARFLDS